MKKAVEIMNVVADVDAVIVEYATGTTRKYPINKIPGTVRAWLDDHAELPEEKAEEANEAETIEIETIETEAIEADAETAAIVAVAPAEVAVIPEAREGNHEEAVFVTLEDVVNTAIKVAHKVVEAVRAHGPALVTVARKVVLWLAFQMVAWFDAMVFWVPELARRMGFRLWALGLEARIFALKTRKYRIVARAKALELFRVARAEARTCVDGFKGLWAMRAELVEEYRAV